ncbi:MAG: shikimate dehydrogenase [Christensenellales bacterium]|jgi:shikimate dehydrogenase
MQYGFNTKRFGVIGDPVAHSLSPLMYNTLFERYGIDALYQHIFIPEGGIDRLWHIVEALSLYGLNVTMPHKKAVIPFMHEMAEEARDCGAVNTIKIESGRMYGFSTDGRGFIAALEETGMSVKGSSVLIMGAGGAASNIAFSMARAGAGGISILNRTVEKARDLAAQIKEKTGLKAQAGNMDSGTINRYAAKSDVIINGTSLGMAGDFDSLEFLKKAPKDAVICETVYHPLYTPLLKKAEEYGFSTVNGAAMLLHQGLLAFEIYTGIKPNADDARVVRELMHEAILKGLGKD